MKRCLILLFSIAFCFLFIATSHSKFVTSLNINSINLSIAAETVEYSVPLNVNNKELFARYSFTDSAEGFDTIENLKTSGGLASGIFEIEDENGIYINDQVDDNGYWVYIQFLGDDGYSSTLNTEHVYYARCEVNIVSINGNGYISFGLYNEQHENGVFGVKTRGVTLNYLTNGYKLTSVHGKPVTHEDFTHTSGEVLVGDYPDSLQFGSAAVSKIEAYIKNVMMLDLTEIFGTGNEPPQSWCDENITIDTAEINWIVNLN